MSKPIRDAQHDHENEYPLGPCMCVLALLGMFSYLCYYFLEYGL